LPSRGGDLLGESLRLAVGVFQIKYLPDFPGSPAIRCPLAALVTTFVFLVCDRVVLSV